ncbi:RimK family alpha-L-glutamate ligase [Streptomyces sp. NPDC058459]|uniref:ATP-grasp domain-containing protein n=1 Tax=Streptomyces sp. NPDC058459 TaxID=3346508 RepID=UPI003658DB82
MPRIALATYDPGPEPSKDPDLVGLAAELRAAGADAEVRFWDDPDADWAGYDLVLIRSTWDYTWRTAEFLAWVDRVDALTRLLNPADVVRWNVDKRYLGELAAAGVPTVPTRYLPPGAEPDLPAGHEYVIKPASGAGARYAARYTPGEHELAIRQLAHMHAEGLTAMVQPYMRGVDQHGERALHFFGGRLLHASRKGAVLVSGTPFDAEKTAHPRLAKWQPTAAELDVAERALAAVPGGAERLLYGRVDLIDGEDGQPRVLELELVEPHLFLELHPESRPRVARLVIGAAEAS